MTLRCKPGDLALVVKGPLNSGKLVRVIALEDPPASHMILRCHRGETWRVDQLMHWGVVPGQSLYQWPHAPDSCLLPIRPEPDDVDARITEDRPAENII